MSAPNRPIALPANQPADRFYRGGDRIAAFRGDGAARGPVPEAAYTPEDWVGSVTEVRGQPSAGLTTLPDGTLLRDAVAADPVGWLGADHAARWGADVRLLVKLLDAGQRLPVHAHPDDAWAAARIGATHGKAEAWYLLEGGPVHLGLRHDVDPAALAELVATQDTAALLRLLHVVDLPAGSSVLVPPGTLHAIGAGVFLAEVQQPEDLSILLEWDGFALDGMTDGHLGVGFDTALGAVDTRALGPERLDVLVRRDVPLGPVLPRDADPWFRLDRVARADLPAGFAIVIGEEGEVELETGSDSVRVRRGETLLVPAAAGAMRFRGEGTALVARPPVA